jgi:hypothetical protein
MSFENRKQVCDKIESEGGLMEALDYGLNCADMPEGDDELVNAWDALYDAYQALQPLARAVEKLLDPDGEVAL